MIWVHGRGFVWQKARTKNLHIPRRNWIYFYTLFKKLLRNWIWNWVGAWQSKVLPAKHSKLLERSWFIEGDTFKLSREVLGAKQRRLVVDVGQGIKSQPRPVSSQRQKKTNVLLAENLAPQNRRSFNLPYGGYLSSTLAFVLAGWNVKTLLWRETEKETTIFLCGNMNEGPEPVKAKAYPTVFVLFIPPRKQLEINVVRLKSTKNLPRKCRVVVQILQPPGAKNVHFTSSWCKSCREFWSPKIRKYRFLRIRLVWASTANVACAKPLRQQPSFYSNRNISTLPPHQSQMFSLLQCRRDLISLRLQRLAASKTTHSSFG